MRIACVVATAVFGLFTYWQFNDFEQYGTRLWYGWVLAYGTVALVSAISASRSLPRATYLAGCVVAAAGAAVRMTAIQWDGKIFYNDTNPAGNETGGLLIVAIWLAVLAWRTPTSEPGSPER